LCGTRRAFLETGAREQVLEFRQNPRVIQGSRDVSLSTPLIAWFRRGGGWRQKKLLRGLNRKVACGEREEVSGLGSLSIGMKRGGLEFPRELPFEVQPTRVFEVEKRGEVNKQGIPNGV